MAAVFSDGDLKFPKLECMRVGEIPGVIFKGTPSSGISVSIGEQTGLITRDEIAALAALFPTDKTVTIRTR